MKDRTYDGRQRRIALSVHVAQARVGLRMLLRLTDRGGWIAPGVLGCAYPRTERAMSTLSGSGVRLLVNLHEQPHYPARLQRHSLREAHLPVKDLAAPYPEQVERGVGAILEALAAGEAVAVHCGGGLGRTDTALACYLASSEGLGAEEAVRPVTCTEAGLRGDLGSARGSPGVGQAPGPLKGFQVWEKRFLRAASEAATRKPKCLRCGVRAGAVSRRIGRPPGGSSPSRGR